MAPGADGVLSCGICGRTIAPETDILGDSWCPSLPNALEDIDYDTVQGVNAEASRGTGVLWWDHIQKASPSGLPSQVLEIGAGTGLLTCGLAMQGPTWDYVATDASAQFLAVNRSRFPRMARPPIWLRCSFERLPFRSGSFDAVLGNSVLHHVYDYETTLCELRRVLRHNGILVLGEPVLQGTVYIGLIARLMLQFADRTKTIYLSGEERRALTDVATMAGREFWQHIAARNRDNWNDKHLFDIEDLKATALRSGFTNVQVFGWKTVDDGYMVEFVAALSHVGFTGRIVDRFAFLFQALQASVVSQLPDQLPTAFAHIVMRASG